MDGAPVRVMPGQGRRGGDVMVGELDGDPYRAALHGVLFLDEARESASAPGWAV